MNGNPFAPGFGTTPPLLVGRRQDLADFRSSFADGVNSPFRSILITGNRGSGKTVLLNAYEDMAREHNWIALSETLSPGLGRRMVFDHIPREVMKLKGGPRGTALTGVQTPVGGATWQRGEEPSTPATLRGALQGLIEIAEKQGRGVLLTLDEVHAAHLDELREIAITAQHMRREGREFTFVAAGLPTSVSDLLSGDVLTFMRRAERQTMDSVSLDDVRDALRVPIEQHGRSIDPDALDYAAEATGGYPFLIQQVGYMAWRTTDGNITLSAAAYAADEARRKVGRLVAAPAIQDLSPVDRSFLLAMAVDSGPSRMADIITRLRVSKQYANTYRLRLLESLLVHQPDRGVVDFTLPMMREYLREEAAHLALVSDGEHPDPDSQAMITPDAN